MSTVFLYPAIEDYTNGLVLQNPHLDNTVTPTKSVKIYTTRANTFKTVVSTESLVNNVFQEVLVFEIRNDIRDSTYNFFRLVRGTYMYYIDKHYRKWKCIILNESLDFERINKNRYTFELTIKKWYVEQLSVDAFASLIAEIEDAG